MTTLKALSQDLGLEFRGPPETQIASVGTITGARSDQITFLANPGYRQFLETTQAAAVILREQDAELCDHPAIFSKDPYVTYAQVAARFAPATDFSPAIHPTAVIAEDARLAADLYVGPYAVIESGAEVGPGTYIGPHCIVGRDSRIGSACRLVARASIMHQVTLGNRVLVHPGAIIGSDGFGLAMNGDHWLKVPQLGGVRIGDDCEIGANTTIDRGALDDTVLGADVRLDNQVQIAHNVVIGAHTALAGCAAVAGSAVIGQYCMIGGGAGVLGHLEVTDHVTLTAMTLVTHSIKEPGTYSSGAPLQPNQTWRKNAARMRRLDELVRRVTALERKLKNDNTNR